MRYRFVVTLLASFVSLVSFAAAATPASQPARMSIFQRLAPEQLEKFDRDRAALAAECKTINVPYPFIRSVLHNHSRLSHDSQGQPDEIIAAAKATNTRIVGFTEHPRSDIDVVAENLKGFHDGVYFLAGTERANRLTWPAHQGQPILRIVSHPEEVESFDRTKVDGIEIYNTHTDALEENMDQLLEATVLRMQAVRARPEAAFSALLDYPADSLARYDRLTADAPFAGIAANDCHQNAGLRLLAHPDGSVQAVTTVGETVYENKGFPAAMLMSAFGQKGKPDATVMLADVQLDRYEVVFRHIGTFLQIGEINEKTVRHAIRTGRIILGFEIVAPLPAVGFWIERDGKPVATVGDEIDAQPGLTLRGLLPLPADIRLIRNGKPIRQTRADFLTIPNLGDGVYRLEAFQTLAGRKLPWVLTNPIYVRSGKPSPKPSQR